MNAATLTDPGCVKTENQDQAMVFPWLGVLDGMGGMNQGGFASRYVADALREASGPPETALREVSQRLYTLARRSRGLFWTGTTAVLAHVADGVLEVVWAGDSRAYAFRTRLVQLTQDHCLSQDPTFPRARSMTRYVGMADLEPEVRRWRFTRPARLLLCSDGVTEELTHAEVAELLPGGTPDEACRRLIDAARARGGRDNLTVVVADGP